MYVRQCNIMSVMLLYLCGIQVVYMPIRSLRETGDNIKMDISCNDHMKQSCT